MSKVATLADAWDMIAVTGAMLPDRLAGEIGYSQGKQSNIKLAFDRIPSCLPSIEKNIKDASLMQKLDLYLQRR